MLTILLYFIFITITCLLTGYYVHLFVRNLVSAGTHSSGKNAIVYALWGLITLTLAGQILELFFPVNQYAWLTWTGILAAVSFFRRKLFFLFTEWLANTFKQHTRLIFPCLVILVFISTISAGPLMMDDTESYHIQMVKWIQAYGTVPGLANLHERYGFNSSWFTFASFFIPADPVHNFYTVANGLLSVWLGVYLFSQSFLVIKKDGDTASSVRSFSCFLILLTALFCWPMIRGNASTGNYDFITTCILIVLWTQLCRPGQPKTQWKAFIPEMIVWPVFLFTIRIINFPLLLISLFGAIQLVHRRSFLLLGFTMLLSAALVIPFLARNVILSGYLFFPVYQVDLFSVDWKADLHVTKQLVTYIKYFNRVNNGFMPISETRKLGFPDWIPVWFHYLFTYDKPLLIAGISGYVTAAIQQKKIRDMATPVGIFIVAMLLQLVSWFMVAPDPRFVYGPLLIGIYLLFLCFPVAGIAIYYTRITRSLMLIVSVGMLGYTFSKVIRNPDYRHLLMPIEVPRPATRLVSVGQIQLFIPEKISGNWNPRCYGTGLPCLYEIQPGLTARGKTAGEGFKLQK